MNNIYTTKLCLLKKNKFFLLAVACFVIVNIFLPTYMNGYSTDIKISLADLYNNNRFQLMLENRLNDPVFIKRPILYGALKYISAYTNLPYQLVYILINFISLISIFVILKRIGNIFQVKTDNSIPFLFIFYPFLFCNTSLIKGFEDFLHWALSLFTFYFLISKNNILAFLFLSLSILTRETTLLMLPLFIFVMEKKTITLLLMLLTIIFTIYIIVFIGEKNEEAYTFLVTKRFTAFNDNFGSLTLIIRSLFSIFLCVFIPLYFLQRNKRNKLIKWMQWTAIITLIIAMFSSLINEARIIFYPLLFTVPFWESGLRQLYDKLVIIDKTDLLIYLCSILIAIPVSFLIYNPCDNKSCIFYQFYMSILLIFLVKYTYTNMRSHTNL